MRRLAREVAGYVEYMANNRTRFTWNPTAEPSIQNWIAGKDIDDWLWDHNAPPTLNPDGTLAFEFYARYPSW